MLAGSTLFQAFSITDCIETLGQAPPDAAWHEEFVIPVLGIKVLGFVMILFILYGLFTLKYFQRWQKQQAERRISEGAPRRNAPLPPLTTHPFMQHEGEPVPPLHVGAGAVQA